MNLFSRVFKAGFTIPNLKENSSSFENSSCQILNGKMLSQHFVQQAKFLVKNKIMMPKLAVILIGENPASQVYVKNKMKLFEQAGFLSQSFFFPAEKTSQTEILQLISELNADQYTHGILVQLPLPSQFQVDVILNSIAPQKDVDGFLPQNMGFLACGNFMHPMACTPFGIMALLKAYDISCEGKHAVVVGRSNIVGKPMGLMLLAANATVTWAHSKTENLSTVCKQADILIVAAGKPEFITKEFVKPGAVVIDVGIHKKTDGKLCGDVHSNVKEVCSALSPVPGGVGPMTIAMLMVNTSLAAWR